MAMEKEVAPGTGKPPGGAAAPPDGAAGRDSGGGGGGARGAVGSGDSFASAVAGGEALASALRKVSRHITPLGMAIIFISNIDRSNLAYAALTFNRDNGFGPQVYSTAVSLFFVTYCVLQMPANLVMLRVGYRGWLAGLVAGWGVVASCFALVRQAWSLFLLRLLLGILEAGALPALWHVFAVFYPASRITVPFSLLSTSILLANMVASPLATGLLAMDTIGGLKGWQWLFILEGVPAVIIGALTWFFLPGSIQDSKFMTQAERDALDKEVARDGAATKSGGGSLRETLSLLRRATSNPYVWMAVAASLCSSIAAQVFLTFSPIIINNLLNGTALSNTATVAAAAGSRSLKPVAMSVVPYALAAATSLLVAWSAQRRGEQFFHVAGCIFVSGVLLALLPVIIQASAAAGFATMCLVIMFGAATTPPLTVLASRLCLGDEQAVVLPIVNSAVVLGGIVGPLVTGAILNRAGGFTYVFVIMGCLDVLEAAVVLSLRFWVNREGGLPDSGRNASNLRVRRRREAEDAAAAAAGHGGGWAVQHEV